MISHSLLQGENLLINSLGNNFSPASGYTASVTGYLSPEMIAVISLIFLLPNLSLNEYRLYGYLITTGGIGLHFRV